MSDTVTRPARTEAMPGLRGKNVLVTGGSSGIGQAIAVRFAEYGANVAINYLRAPEEAADTEERIETCVRSVQQHGVRDLLVGGDVSNEADVVRMVGETIEGLGGLDVLVNNAGIQISCPSHELSSDDFDKVIAVNLRGAFLCAREALRHFVAEEKAGSIVNVTSVHQLIPKPDYLGYSASKGGMQNLTRTLALEYAGRGIRVNGIGPGATVTPINRAWIDDPVKRAAVEEHIPLRRAGTADEMGALACFLSSDDAALHHRPDHLRRRWSHPVPELCDALVLGMTSVTQTDVRWWPSAWGDGDELGMLNHIDDAKRLQALSVVREGRVYDLGHELHEDVPVFPGRFFRQTLVTTAHHANKHGGLGENDVNWITEQVTATMQLGTHLDSLAHLQIGDRGYNGWTVSELADTAGVRHLGAETIPQIVTRGWLVDVSAARSWRRGRDLPRRRLRHPGRAGRRGLLPHRLERRAGTSRPPTWTASLARAWRSPSGSSSTAWRSPAATPGATGRCRPRTPRARSRCRRASTSVTASSSSRTSTPVSSPPTASASSR